MIGYLPLIIGLGGIFFSFQESFIYSIDIICLMRSCEYLNALDLMNFMSMTSTEEDIQCQFVNIMSQFVNYEIEFHFCQLIAVWHENAYLSRFFL